MPDFHNSTPLPSAGTPIQDKDSDCSAPVRVAVDECRDALRFLEVEVDQLWCEVEALQGRRSRWFLMTVGAVAAICIIRLA